MQGYKQNSALVIRGVFMSYSEEDVTADIFAEQISAVFFVIDLGKSAVALGNLVTEALGGGYCLASPLREKAHGRIPQAPYAYSTAVAHIYRCRLTADDNAVLHLDKHPALSALASAEAVERCTVFYFGIDTAEHGSTERCAY